jgi:hypothetical protein
MSLNQPLLLSSALVHQVLLNQATYPSKHLAVICPSNRLIAQVTISGSLGRYGKAQESLITWSLSGSVDA